MSVFGFCYILVLLWTSCITSPANVIPKIAVMCTRLPFVLLAEEQGDVDVSLLLSLVERWLLVNSSLSSLYMSAPLLGSSSSLYTHWNLCLGKSLLFLKYCLKALARGHPRTFQNSPTITFVGSSFSAAPIDEKNLALVLHARRINRALWARLSIASIIQSYLSRLKLSAVSVLKVRCMAVTEVLGLMSCSRWRRASTFGLPMVDVVAGSCLFMLLAHIQSGSTMVRLPIPVRTNASAHQLPTPPTPKSMTRVCVICCIELSPSNNPVRLNMLFSVFILYVFIC